LLGRIIKRWEKLGAGQPLKASARRSRVCRPEGAETHGGHASHAHGYVAAAETPKQVTNSAALN
jgi:hypothetical protein